jgi:hypothetical protein
MTLTSCPVCGGQVSAAAANCPHCGHPLGDRLAPQPAAGRLTRGNTTAARILLFITSALAAATAVGQLVYGARIGAFIERASPTTADAVVDAEELAAVLAGWDIFIGIVALVLLMIWGSRAYHDVLARGPTGGSWGPGWAVGGWFVPLANLAIPKLTFNEIDRMSHPETPPPPIGDLWRRLSLVPAGNLWWFAGVASVVLFFIGVAMEQNAEVAGFVTDFEGYRSGVWVVAIAYTVAAVSQLAGASYIKTLGERFHG